MACDCHHEFVSVVSDNWLRHFCKGRTSAFAATNFLPPATSGIVGVTS